MTFNSITFLIFFPIVTLFFYLLPYRFRWPLLLAASCFFYMYFVPQYILILLITILIDYVAGIYIEQNKGKRRKLFLVVSIISTCLVLVFFKYLAFFNQNLIALSHWLGFPYPEKVIEIILPIGLSFHTFQSLSYVIEVYRGNQKAEWHFGLYALYVMFYPQLVTGPIERPSNLLRQLRETQVFQYDNLVRGLRLILFGLFVKMVIADNLGIYVDKVYENPQLYNSRSIFIALFFYSFQIYCDFLGYSTIAVGCAQAMGFSITNNFRAPYLARNISDFWHRWHISLSTWFRDYLYFPMGGSRMKVPRWILNIFVVFILSGFWHGANWTFLLWGFAYAVIYLIERPFKPVSARMVQIKKGWKSLFYVIMTAKNFVLVTFIWIFFRAANLMQIKTLWSALTHNGTLVDEFTVEPKVWFFLVLFILFDILLRHSRFDTWCANRHPVVRWSVYALLIFSTIVFAAVNSYPFIYFQF